MVGFVVGRRCVRHGPLQSWVIHRATGSSGKLNTLFGLLLTSYSSLSPPNFFFWTVI